jgi:hypothetical protein
MFDCRRISSYEGRHFVAIQLQVDCDSATEILGFTDQPEMEMDGRKVFPNHVDAFTPALCRTV